MEISNVKFNQIFILQKIYFNNKNIKFFDIDYNISYDNTFIF